MEVDVSDLPLKVQLVPLVGPSIETNLWACPNCHWIWTKFSIANACCEKKDPLVTHDNVVMRLSCDTDSVKTYNAPETTICD